MPSVFDFANQLFNKVKLPMKVTGDAATIQALALNSAFPASPDGKNILGQLSFTTPTGNCELPGLAQQAISLQASASSSSVLAAYTDSSELGTELGFVSEDMGGLQLGLPAAAGQRYLALNWTLNATAAAAGSLALAPGITASLAVNAAAGGRFAFIRSVDAGLPARTALATMLSDLTSPGALVKGASLPEGCWIVTEADGSLDASLGVKAGYDFNWVKSLALNDLSGDLGLRIEAAVACTVTAKVEGRFYMLVGRDPGQVATRLRIFRKRTAATGIVLDAGVDVTPSTGTLTPGRLDGFVQAVLGIKDAQLLSFLKGAPLPAVVEGLGAAFLQKLNPAGVQQGFTALQTLLAKWDGLPHTAATVVWKYATDDAVLSRLRAALTVLAANDASAIHKLLSELLKDVSFTNNPICEWLEGASEKTLFDLYSGQGAAVKAAAVQALAVLDGSAVQATLTKLADAVSATLDLSSLKTAVNGGDLGLTSHWVSARLAEFLGVTLPELPANLARLQQVLKGLGDRLEAIYEATVKALNTTYGFSVAAAWNRSSEQSALIDASFAPGAESRLAEALTGRFGAILNGPLPGVTLNVGTLTHGLTRNSHVAIHLPWWTGAADDLATAQATAHFADEVDGRVQLVDASATDTVTTRRGTNLARFASCSAGMSGLAQGVRRYNLRTVNFGFTYRTAQTRMAAGQLYYSLKDVGEAYFPSTFHTTTAFADFVAGLSAAADAGGALGTVWSSLQVELRPVGDADWVSLLLNGAAPDYRAMSLNMQDSLRIWLLIAYGSDPARFANVTTAQSMLVYAAMPRLNEVTLDSDGDLLPAKPNGGILWDTLDGPLVSAVARAHALERLPALVQSVAVLLAGISGHAGDAQYYDGKSHQLLSGALTWPAGGAQDSALVRYLQAERTLIDDARSAFEGLRKAGKQDLQHALPSFASALLNLVETFNARLQGLSLDAPEVMRNFAPLVLQNAIQAMFHDKLQFQRDAFLDVALMKGSTLPTGDEPPATADTRFRERVLTA